MLCFLLVWRTCPYALWIPHFSSRILLYIWLSSPESLSSPSGYFSSSSAHSHLLLVFFPSQSNCLHVLPPFPTSYSRYNLESVHTTLTSGSCRDPWWLQGWCHLDTIWFSHLLHLSAGFDQLATPYFLIHICSLVTMILFFSDSLDFLTVPIQLPPLEFLSSSTDPLVL